MPATHFCPQCGAPHPEGTHFCATCGETVDTVPSAPATSAYPPPPPAPMAAPAPMAVPVVAPVTSAGDQGRSRLVPWIAAGVLAVLLIGGLAAFFVTRGSDGGDGEGEVFLEPVSLVPPDPFTANVDIHNVATSGAAPATTAPVIATTAPPATATTTATSRSVAGAWPGLYGGTRDRATCDSDKLVGFLEANPQKAQAWAGVLGIRSSDIRAYVRTLTPVILQRDTRVTNHGFRNGRATPTQSVLQAGTAVLVDGYGVPRVKCNCGNPLAEPRLIRSTPRYTGNRWPTFAPANTIRVTTDIKVSVFILVDVKGGEPIRRPAGTTGKEDAVATVDNVCDLFPTDPTCVAATTTTTTAPSGEPTLGTGDVQATLRWSSKADLDLAVNDPTGAQIDFENRTSPSGGTLDVDSNRDCTSASSSGVENIFWPTGKAPEGTYTFTVTYFDVCQEASGPQSYELSISFDGSAAALTPASLRRSEGQTTATYEVQIGTPHASGLALPTGRVQAVSGTLQPGASASYQSEKGPGYNGSTTTTAAPDSTPDAPPPGDDPGTTPADQPKPLDCSKYEEGSMMRILCEHDPGSAVDPDSLPIPVPGN